VILAAAVLGLAYGLLRKDGYPSSILKKHFHIWPLIFISLAIQWLLGTSFYQSQAEDFDKSSSLRLILVIVQYALLMLFLFQNGRKPGMLGIMAGAFLNGLVMIANGGRMPIGLAIHRFGQTAVDRISEAPDYFLSLGSEPLLFLGDMIPFWTFGWYMISVGDIIVAVSLFFLAAYMPRRILRPRPAPDTI
jgi:hypothetical protein